ncbi:MULTISPECIES: hypothetical protein [Massilia]|uniref:hypothetical protein n=1 Tax=Massilia TaxID=149698 RepID=UPI000A90D510|nr:MULTISPECIES: hypothetical protein [Massilia]
MGRRSKPPVHIQLLPDANRAQLQDDGLPPLKRFIDISDGGSRSEQKLTRFYLQTPSSAEVIAAKANGIKYVIGGNSGNRGLSSLALPDFASQKITPGFGHQLARLMIHFLTGKYKSYSTLTNIVTSVKIWIEFISTSRLEKLDGFNIYSIEYQDWLDYRSFLETGNVKGYKRAFGDPRSIFSSYHATSFDGNLQKIAWPNPRRNNAPEPHNHSGDDIDGAYSDAIMYQLLAQFLYRFKRQIAYLKHYEELTLESLGEDWIFHGRKPRRASNGRADIYNFLHLWLSTEIGYGKILNHKLLWFKLNFHSKKQFTKLILGYAKYCPDLAKKYEAYVVWERKTHLLHSTAPRHNVFGLYAKRSVKDDKTGALSQLAFCLVNIVMIYTGLNKEVVLSWSSRIDGKSILSQGDTLFVRKEGAPKEVEIIGWKRKTGSLTKDKPIAVAIVIDSPLYQMLEEYERHAKTNFDGPFFEMAETVVSQWGRDLNQRYPVTLENGELLQSLETKRFRKVFATTKMLEHLSGVVNSQELADRLQSDLDHNTLDVTLSNYIMRSQNATAVLDIAIATITSKNINQALEFAGEVSLEDKPEARKSLYLCECKDPANPTHGMAIAKECTYYDLCLGCRRSIICQKHLPYICLRILQYEEQRLIMGVTWNAVYEDRWLIANDALNKYKKKNSRDGEALVQRAWEDARSGAVSLPPIIQTKV